MPFFSDRCCLLWSLLCSMKPCNFVSTLSDSKTRSCLCSIFVAVALFFGVYFVGSVIVAKDNKERLLRWRASNTFQHSQSDVCKSHCRPLGSEVLPEGIVAKTSNLETRPLWDSSRKKGNQQHRKSSVNLLAISVGIKQKEIVNHIIQKFSSNDFVVMLFHYDGIVDEWKDLEWSNQAIHVSAMNQTKWWFAKRFLHPDIVADYEYIFLWDEDLGVANFDPVRYLSIVKDEGLEISQPALDPSLSDVHHQITARVKKSKIHRRTYKVRGSGRCDEQSTAPPCVGWVEMMAPVFSKAAWRCAWYMIQNDLIHAWGLDKQLGYCAQGDRTRNVGVVDSEYIVHLGLPTLGISDKTKLNNESSSGSSLVKHSANSAPVARAGLRKLDNRPGVRRRSYAEMQIFERRWKHAIMEDKCWIDPY